ncbi:maleylpyruvate isomerase N-terminal domain-containing protein [Saccharopolyspora kobensis]|uniref:maleylpyruvate isomerase N-terminal domain-containing protein n=1 Tax=Saccharopolyspora kobensis TaxID=146035 RepID=UPI000B806F59
MLLPGDEDARQRAPAEPFLPPCRSRAKACSRGRSAAIIRCVTGEHEQYRQVRLNIAELVRGAGGAPVPACPGWAVPDLVRHLTEIAPGARQADRTTPARSRRSRPAPRVGRGRHDAREGPGGAGRGNRDAAGRRRRRPRTGSALRAGGTAARATSRLRQRFPVRHGGNGPVGPGEGRSGGDLHDRRGVLAAGR